MKAKINPGIIVANLAVIALAVVTYVNLNTIQLRYPYNGMVTDDRTPALQWYGQGHGYELLVDEDPGFGSPVIFGTHGNIHELHDELEFGTYWWKVRSGQGESGAWRFSVVSTVALSRLESDMVMNSGNVPLLVHLGRLTGAATLAVNQTLEIGEGEDVKAEQK